MEWSGPEDPSAELERLAQEQFTELEQEDPERPARNRARCERVIALYHEERLASARDFFHAALVVLYAGHQLEHFELARSLATRAARLGEPRAWWLIAAAWDRSLIEQGRPQRFGTQLMRENGRISLGPIDPEINDRERAMYAVLPLWVQQQNVEQLRRREEQR